MNNLNEIIVRIKADVQTFNNPIDIIRGDIPQFWRGNDIRFQIGAFNGDDILNVENYASISLAIRKMTNDGNVPSASTPALMQKVCTSIDSTISVDSWNSGSKEHASIIFSSDESNIISGDHWLSIWASTKDSTPKIITLCAGIIRVLEVGGGNSSLPPDPVEIYYTSQQCDDKFISQSSVSTDPNLGNSDIILPSQKAVKTYVDSKPSFGEVNTASNIGVGDGIFAEKVGVDLRFKSIKAGSNVTLIPSDSEIIISSSGGGSGGGMENPMTSRGEMIYSDDIAGTPAALSVGTTGQVLKINNYGIPHWATDLGFDNPMTDPGDIIIGGNSGIPSKLSKGSNGQVLKSTGSSLEWAAETIESTSASNTGSGLGIFKEKTGSDLKFKSLKAGENISLSADDTEIVIAGTSAGGENFPTKYVSNCVISAPNGVVTYNGTTITIKSGLKILIPNGRSDDGTVKNIEYQFETDGVFSNITVAPADSDRFLFIRYDNGTMSVHTHSTNEVIFSRTSPNPEHLTFPNINWFNPETNIWKTSTNAGISWSTVTQIAIARYSCDGTEITKFTHLMVTSLWNSFNSLLIGKLAMPGDKYIDITPGSSGATYIAPGTGWVTAEGTTFATSGALILRNTTTKLVVSDATYSSGSYLGITMPIKSGDAFIFEYLKINSVTTFRFIYAQGDLCI